MRSGIVLVLIAAATLAPLALANNTTTNQNVTVNNPTPQINVNNPAPQESSTGAGIAGMDATTGIVVLVLAVLLIALVIGFAGRDRWW